MHSLEEMVSGVRTPEDLTELDGKSLSQCIEACSECQTLCLMCADACIHETDVPALRRCIRLCLDAADLATTAMRLLSRAGQPDLSGMRSTLEACESVCATCSVECKKHAAAHPYCGICAEACAACARACLGVLETLFEGPSA
jgi:hypothetical protein